MRYRAQSLFVVVTFAALLLAAIGLCIRKQQRIDELEARLSALEKGNAALKNSNAALEKSNAMLAAMANPNNSKTNVGVRWEVEQAMLMDGISPTQQLSR